MKYVLLFIISDTGLFMPSYRKPKRVRTAFSPTQLLRLEHAFEKNHYVVGQERKDLSASLNLSETQVSLTIFTPGFLPQFFYLQNYVMLLLK